jgi:hypothetical protein
MLLLRLQQRHGKGVKGYTLHLYRISKGFVKSSLFSFLGALGSGAVYLKNNLAKERDLAHHTFGEKSSSCRL